MDDNISFALPQLVEALSRYSSLVNAMRVLFHEPSADRAQARLILDTIRDSDRVAAYVSTIEQLKAVCEGTLASEE